MELRVCRTCGESKSLDEMAMSTSGHGKHRKMVRGHHCKTCKNAQAREWRKKNPDKVRASSLRRKDRPGFIENKRAYMNQRYHSWDMDTKRDIAFRRAYGISLAEYQDMERQQQGLCAICGEPPNKDIRPGILVVDHCHTGGQVRGLLCSTCNLAIGYFKDNPDCLLSAAAYLLKNSDVLNNM